MQLDKFVVGIIALMVVIVAGSMVADNVSSSYNIDMGVEEYLIDSESTARGNSTFSYASGQQEKTLGSTFEEENSADELFAGGFSAIRLITTPVKITGEIFNQIAKELHIDKIFVQFAFTALLVLVIFAVIALIFRIKA